MTGDDPRASEFYRLRAELLASQSRVKELEDALARCTARGIRLSEVLKYHDPEAIPPPEPGEETTP